MALPASRTEFKEYCLEQLGAPVLEINLAEEQIQNQIDYALSKYAEYHFDGTIKHYYKYQVVANLFSDAIHHLTLVSGGTGYSNSDTVVFSSNGHHALSANAEATITTNGNGTITAVNLANNGAGYATTPTISITTSGGSGASITAELGGYIELPENIIGISRVFPLSYLSTGADMFSINYQMALNNIYTLTNSQLVPYYMSMQHLQLFHDVLVGQTPFRYNKNHNRLYIDKAKQRLTLGEYIVFECYNVLDPDTYTDIWKDRWLIRYATELMKKQWGTNLKKFSGMMLPGGIVFSGQTIYDEAVEELKVLDDELLNSWSIPVLDIVS